MAKPALRRFLPALVALGALASCGGGEIVAVLGFVGSAGGDWKQDDLPADGLQQRSTCGAGGTDDCFINIQPVGGQNLFVSDFDVSFTSNLPSCPASGTGRASGKRMTLTLSCDHRVIDGALGAKVLAVIVEQLEAPEALAL